MFCEACGSRMEEGSLICSTCNTLVREPRSAPIAEQVPNRPAPELELAGPKCAEHPGMPLAGACPRCGKPVCIRCAPGAARDVFTCTDCAGLSSAHQQAPPDATCAAHPGVRARFICSRCGSFACSACAATAFGSEGQCVRCGQPQHRLATRGARFAANLVDNVVVVLPIGAAFAIAAIGGGLGKKGNFDEVLLILGGVFGVVVGCASQVIAQLRWGQSVGKRMLGIKVVRLNGQPIELWRLILLRNIALQVIAQACGAIGLVDALMIFGDQQRCLHDYLADSIVVDAPRT